MSRPPDILWIVTTQWRAQALGHAGNPNARTPCLDSFAHEPGTMRFAQAVTPHPLGPFARAAMFTGVPSPENGIRDYYDPLPTNARTIAHDLRERHGYATAFFGKWHLAKRDPGAPLVGEAHARTVVPPEERGGFDFWEGFESGFLLNDPFLHGTRLPEPQVFRGYQSDVLCGQALDYTGGLSSEKNPGRAAKNRAPWFCVVSMEAPHPPYSAVAGGVAPQKPENISLPANVPRGGDTEARARLELAGYYAHIEATDAAIGRLIAGVRIQSKNAIIVFASVHGDMHGAHGFFRKGWPHEESVRVPLLINGPRIAGGVSLECVSLVDLPGMTLAFATGEDAREVRPYAHISMPSVVRLPHQCDRAWRGVRSASRKLILNEDGSPWLFFDLESDPLEMRNLANDDAHAAEIAALRRAV